MMNELQIFKSPEFGEVRVLEIDGVPWFIGKDVAKALGYAKPENALAAHVDNEDKNTTLIQGGIRGNPNKVIINESGLYSLVLSSKLPSAKRFKRWITSEVLPSIRKHGGYIAGQETLTDMELMAKALIMANNMLKERDALIVKMGAKIEADAPLVQFANTICGSDDAISVGEMATLLKQGGKDTGQNRLYKELREMGCLVKGGSRHNMPTQRAMEMGLFNIQKQAYTIPGDSRIHVSSTTKVTAKGQMILINKLLPKQTDSCDQETEQLTVL